MDMRDVFKRLGFEEDWEAITDEAPAYFYDFGNMRLEAAQVLNRYFAPCFHLGGVWSDHRTVAMIDFDVPLVVETHEQGTALLAHSVGKSFQPANNTPWLDEGRKWKEFLPWELERRRYEERPQCTVDKEWVRVATKKLRPLAATATDGDLACFEFDGEVLKIYARHLVVAMPAKGKPWPSSYCIKCSALEFLPLRLSPTVGFGVWENHLTIAGRRWNLQAQEATKFSGQDT